MYIKRIRIHSVAVEEEVEIFFYYLRIFSSRKANLPQLGKEIQPKPR